MSIIDSQGNIRATSVMTWRTFAVFLLGMALVAFPSYRFGKVSCENDSNNIMLSKQRKVNDIHTEVYSSVPNNRDDIIKWMHNKVR